MSVWLKFDEPEDDDPSHEANIVQVAGHYHVEWCNSAVGQVTEVHFDTEAEAEAWLEAAGYLDFSS